MSDNGAGGMNVEWVDAKPTTPLPSWVKRAMGRMQRAGQTVYVEE